VADLDIKALRALQLEPADSIAWVEFVKVRDERDALRAALSEPGDEVDAWLRERKTLTDENTALRTALRGCVAVLQEIPATANWQLWRRICAASANGLTLLHPPDATTAHAIDALLREEKE
jgi:hypothetical protein